MTIFKIGQRVRISYHGQQTDAWVTVASDNGRSLVVEFPDRMVGGFAGMMPLFWDEKTNEFIDLMVNDPVTIEAV
jgi:hypothetical protein